MGVPGHGTHVGVDIFVHDERQLQEDRITTNNYITCQPLFFREDNFPRLHGTLRSALCFPPLAILCFEWRCERLGDVKKKNRSEEWNDSFTDGRTIAK